MRTDQQTDTNGFAGWSSISYSARHEDLALGMPVPLRTAPPSRMEFSYARDPYIALQYEAMKQSEARRRGEGDSTEAVELEWPLVSKPASITMAFNMVRDPLIAAQTYDLAKPEAQRRQENGGQTVRPERLRRPLKLDQQSQAAKTHTPSKTMSSVEIKRQRSEFFDLLERQRKRAREVRQEVKHRRSNNRNISMV